MKKLAFFALACALAARENPFLPLVKIEQPSELVSEVEFNKMAFSFPKDARKLARVKLEYLAMDGSIKTHEISVQQPIDWHKIYLIISENELENATQNLQMPSVQTSDETSDDDTKDSEESAETSENSSEQNAANMPSEQANKEEKSSEEVATNEQKTAAENPSQNGEKISAKEAEKIQQQSSQNFANKTAKKSQAVLELENSEKNLKEFESIMTPPKASKAPNIKHITTLEPNMQKDDLKIEESKDFEKITINNKLAIVIKQDNVKVITKNRMIRQFALNHPDRIVLDFELKDEQMGAHTFPLLNSSFDSLLIGVHKKFFRVVLHTDSKYDYELSYDEEGCTVKLK